MAKSTIGTKQIGTFVFDVTTGENHESTLRSTSNPVENGSNISDHSFLDPKKCTVHGVLVDYDPPVAGSTLDILSKVSAGASGVAEVLGGLVLSNFDPKAFMTSFNPAEAIDIDGVVTDVTNTAAKAVSDIQNMAIDIVAQEVRNIAPWLPGPILKGLGLDTTNQRIRRMLEALEDLQKNGELLEVITEAKLYKDMQIMSISSITRKNSALEVVVNLEQKIVVAPQLVIATGLSGGAADLSESGKGRKGNKSSPSGEKAEGSGKDESSSPKKTGHQSVTERMRGQVNAEWGKLKSRMGF